MIETTADQLKIGDVIGYNQLDKFITFYKITKITPTIHYSNDYLFIDVM
jgi:hypothetical protein